jgi:hypothetical protein
VRYKAWLVSRGKVFLAQVCKDVAEKKVRDLEEIRGHRFKTVRGRTAD